MLSSSHMPSRAAATTHHDRSTSGTKRTPKDEGEEGGDEDDKVEIKGDGEGDESEEE